MSCRCTIKLGRKHEAVCHSRHEYVCDDSDGIREVYYNIMERVWAGLRNFIAPFCGIHKDNLPCYAAMFEWAQQSQTYNWWILENIDDVCFHLVADRN
ncbi:hypothetical protein CCP3SC1_460031 [Gammaproteobacteria bacterium]